MSVFGKIFKNNRKKDVEDMVITKNKNIAEIAENFCRYKQTYYVGKELKDLVDTGVTDKTEYEKIIDTANEVAKSISTNINTEKIEEIIKSLKEIKHSENEVKYKDFTEFAKDFIEAGVEYYTLKDIQTLSDVLKKEIEESEIYSQYTIFINALDEVKVRASELNQKETELSEEIEKYSKAIEYYQTKYRLSIDWDGKKNMMIALGKKLRDRRDELEKLEAKTNLEVKALYDAYPTIKRKLASKINFIIGRIYEEQEEVLTSKDVLTLIEGQSRKLKEEIEKFE